MLSGGSFASTSVTCAATTVTVQVSPSVKSVVGSSENELGPPPRANGCAPETVQEIVNAEPFALTGSSKLTVMFVFDGRLTAPFAGVVLCTAGGASKATVKT